MTEFQIVKWYDANTGGMVVREARLAQLVTGVERLVMAKADLPAVKERERA